MSVHERAAKSIEKKISVIRNEIDFSLQKMNSLPDRNLEKSILNRSIREKEGKICECKEALELERRLINKPYRPGVIGTVTDFGYCIRISDFDLRPEKNPEWHLFDSFVTTEKYYPPVIDAYQQSIENGVGGMYNWEVEESILDNGNVTSYMWVNGTLKTLSRPEARVDMSCVPQVLLKHRKDVMPKVLKLKTRNKMRGSFPKPSYDIPLIPALNERFRWKEFAERNGLNPKDTIMKWFNLQNVHLPELARDYGVYKERDRDAAFIIEAAARKEAKITLEQKDQKYSIRFPKSKIGPKDPLTYNVRLTDSTTFTVDSQSSKSETTYCLPKWKQIDYGEALSMINNAWEKELERKKYIRNKFLGRSL
jgi:hypothetical protein